MPQVVADNELDLPFKYNYTVVPCMNYGRLDHLAVSNTVDFSQLHAFNHSNFNTWKYHIDESQLRLTFGAEIFDTFEDDKVDGLILEFYDLWGFAGSLEINDKKSYSGVFTKILTLGSPNVLSRKLIVGNQYKEGYKHHISITPKDGGYYLNDKSLTWSSSQGWNIDDEYNDCGTLYPNVIYGVKTYLRQTSSDGTYKFTRKKDFFLYTLPIFNDYYYTVNDFSAIENPTLDLMLTYKLTDSSQRFVYNSDYVIDGYEKEVDYIAISEYLKGQTKETSLSGTKYYSYVGTSNLCLEIGLKQEYQQFGLSYSPEINNLFSCKLQLISDDVPDRTFTVKSGDSEAVSALNYKQNTELTINSNKVTFGSIENPTQNILEITPDKFIDYNFINNENKATIPIKYQFIVGYPLTISDIRDTEVPATTVCALFHQNKQGRYNLEDFGLHDISEDPNISTYTSNRMFMNAGAYDIEVFGIVAHVKLTGTALEQYEHVDHIQRRVIPRGIDNSKALNSGEPMQLASKYLGKLTFMQPHAHNNWTNYDNGVNITYDNNGGRDSYKWKLSSAVCAGQDVQGGRGTNTDDIHGVKPSTDWAKNPCYNMTVNTLNSVNNYSESISTLHYEEARGIIWGWDVNDYGKDDEWDTKNYNENQPQRRFVGFTGEQLSDFYAKLTTTMKGIYARNPDYDRLALKIGSVNVNENPISFVSNLISTNARLTFAENKVFNDYLYIGTVSFTDYFLGVQRYSQNSEDALGIVIYEHINETHMPKPVVNFNPSYTYLGPENSAYLITALTYNTSAPIELTTQLEIKTSNMTCVKHEDGSYVFIEGTPNDRVLYGFDKSSQKLIQLDVSNYTIDELGQLQLIPDMPIGSGSFTSPITLDMTKNLYTTGHVFKHSIKDATFGNTTLAINMSLGVADMYYLTRDDERGLVYFLTSGNADFSPFTSDIQVIDGEDGYSYTNVAINKETFAQTCDVQSITLNLDISPESLQSVSPDLLYTWMERGNSHIPFTYVTTNGEEATFTGNWSDVIDPVVSTFTRIDSLRIRSFRAFVITCIKLGEVSFKFDRAFDFTKTSL